MIGIVDTEGITPHTGVGSWLNKEVGVAPSNDQSTDQPFDGAKQMDGETRLWTRPAMPQPKGAW
jgi:hypothetical protein